MGKMKSYMMDNQEKYEELLLGAVSTCETYEEYIIIANAIADMHIIDLPEDMLEEIQDYVYEAYWSDVANG